ncbi:MAG: SUMF1/EgtB/PvdO family nonheme iron enzyme [Chitinophagales bacterium]|nr:SUMF1/EgtB/PvdO family nonheme iron enzyme [Bacteroidota bacterium]MCB9043558.1 SUMF1/EgtB/PvdO family nonheme iron enzyme [Chitinophagales bacterium]
MKNVFLCGVLYVAFMFAGCSGSDQMQGQLTGVETQDEWRSINPFGMVYIPSGTLHIGQADQDVNATLTQRSKAISIQGFYMDDTEITNNEYRQFVDWVRDSIALTKLDAFIDSEDGSQRLDWSYPIDWSAESEDASALKSMYYSGDDQFWGRQELDPRQLTFAFEWYDWKEAAKNHKTYTDVASRKAYIHREEVPIYPDTLVWIADFSYSYNEPMTRNYFWHPAFDDYPVVGVNWNQANAFCGWRTKLWNDYANEYGETMGEDFRLPFEHEWEYASRGGLEGAPYPWGGPYIRNSKGCLLANFKPGRGDYPEDGGFYTVKVGSYNANDYGLYDMSGNVSEWTSSAYFENAYSFIHDMNPDIRWDAQEDDPITLRRKVIRGGSWKDIGYYLQTGTRHWEYQDTAKSYIGFRCTLTFLGRSMGDFAN